MAMKVDYVAKETVSNLRRNLSMASAALITVAVSLTLAGGALLVKRGEAAPAPEAIDQADHGRAQFAGSGPPD